MAQQLSMSHRIPIVDSHIHLYPATHLPTLAWHSPDNPIGTQHSVDEYRQAVTRDPKAFDASNTFLRGFVFIETDRLSSLSENDAKLGWKYALDEISFLSRIASGTPLMGEGHSEGDKDICLGIVAWAPVPAGPEALARYITLAKARAGESWGKFKGMRYLLQDKSRYVALKPDFISGIQYLGKIGLSFDLGVDARQGGMWQLDQAIQMMNKVYDGDSRTTIIISKLT